MSACMCSVSEWLSVLDRAMVSSALLLIDYRVCTPTRQSYPALQEEPESACDQRKRRRGEKQSTGNTVNMTTKAPSHYHLQLLASGEKWSRWYSIKNTTSSFLFFSPETNKYPYICGFGAKSQIQSWWTAVRVQVLCTFMVYWHDWWSWACPCYDKGQYLTQ